MTRKDEPRNKIASLKARLLEIARERKIDYNALLRLYFQERFIDRISKSKYSDNFILKGALLFLTYDMTPDRLTQDIDSPPGKNAVDGESILLPTSIPLLGKMRLLGGINLATNIDSPSGKNEVGRINLATNI